MLKHRTSFVLLLSSLAAQAQTALPESPEPQQDRIKPFAMNLTLAERFHDNPQMPHGEDIMVGGGVDYRLYRNRTRVGIFYSYAPLTRAQSVTGSLSFKVWEWGRRK